MFGYQFFGLVLVSIVLIFVDHLTNWFDDTRSFLNIAVTPVLILADFPNRSYRAVSEVLSTRDDMRRRILDLESQLVFLKAKTEKMASLTAENNRLRDLLGSAAKLQENVLVAELIGVNPDPNEQEIIVDKGSVNNVFVGQPVLDASGLLGQVVEVSEYTARILLISDLNHSIPVLVLRTNLRLIARGTGIKKQLEMVHVNLTADIQIGDQLLSSGLGDRFPAGYPVGIVESILSEPGRPFLQVRAKPSAQLERSRHVLLVFTDSPRQASGDNSG